MSERMDPKAKKYEESTHLNYTRNQITFELNYYSPKQSYLWQLPGCKALSMKHAHAHGASKWISLELIVRARYIPPQWPQWRSHPLIFVLTTFCSQPDGGVVGVSLGVVLDTCFVVAGNQPGELHLYGPPHERVTGDDLDGLLVPGLYHFVVIQAGGGLDYNYQVGPRGY
ncbi:hypothetical protein C8R45DRAFT_937588 [Mycena sanguinolenta]|nr:hypothetical protein C8R45DRAFT_937588 [Mycena sanguinolenta]